MTAFRRIGSGLMVLALVLGGAATGRVVGAAEPLAQLSVVRGTLANGLRVVIVRQPFAPVVTTEMNYLVGSNEAPPGFPGMAHAQEHMMFRGSPGLTAAQLSYVSAAMGGRFDADTQQVVTQYVFTVAAEDLDVALRIEAIRMRGVLDSEQGWRQERGAIEQEVAQDLSNPQYLMYTELLKRLFAGTPYALDALGTRASFERTTAAMLKRFHDAWYAPNNAILVVVGDVQAAPTLELIRTLFGDIPSRPLPARPPVTLRPVTAETMRLDTDLPYGLAVVAFRLPGFDDPDYAAARVLMDVLGSQRGALQNLVAEGQALDAGASFSPLPPASLAFVAAAFPSGGSPDDTLARVRSIVQATATQPIDGTLVDAAKQRVLTQREVDKTSIDGLASRWSEALAVEGRQSPDDDTAAIQRVTTGDVERVARRYLDPDHSVTAILTPKASGKPVTAKGFGGRESFTPPHTEKVALPAWAEGAVKRLSVPTSAVNPTVTVLANGLRLLVQPESASRSVAVLGRVKQRAALEVPPGQEGVDEVLDDLFAFGTTSLDRVAFRRALDAIGADASAGADFSLQVLADQFDRGIALLADNELRPALPPAAFETTRRQVAARVAGRLDSADYRAERALRRGLVPAGDPTLREATAATVSALTLDDVRAYYRRAFRPDLTTIVVIGAVTPERARAVVERYFGPWIAEGPPPPTDLPPIPPNKAMRVDVPNSTRVQDRVVLAQTLGINRFDPDYYALDLGNHVLGGAFYATRLYRDLRQSAGLVYAVDSALEMSRTRGAYIVEYGCDPPNVSRAREIILQELRAMQRTAVPADELRRAKAVLLRRIVLAEGSLDDIAGGLLSRAVEGLPVDEPTRAARRQLALTADEVKASFAKWIRPSDFVQVTEGPTPR